MSFKRTNSVRIVFYSLLPIVSTQFSKKYKALQKSAVVLSDNMECDLTACKAPTAVKDDEVKYTYNFTTEVRVSDLRK